MKPHITEKTMAITAEGSYTFKVPRKMNKYQAKRLIQEKFKVEVIKVRTIKVKGKTRSAGKRRQKTKLSDWKKVIVQLKEGQKIEGFGIKDEKTT